MKHMSRVSIELQSPIGLAWDGQRMELGRCTVVLGENGAGKSRLLRAIKAAWPHAPESVLHLVDGRLATFPPRIVLSSIAGNDQPLEDPRGIWLADLLGGQEVLDHLKLDILGDGAEQRLGVRQGGRLYDVREASDGEQEVFKVLAAIVARLTEDQTTLMLVDEPERGLHPMLADRLWSDVERMMGPRCCFVYATHSVQFAVRSSVDTLLHVDRTHGLMPLSGIDQLDPMARVALLGQLPIAARAVLFCEGVSGGLDHQLYSWLLEKDGIAVVPLGECHRVVGAIEDPVWAWSCIRGGVVDRDQGYVSAPGLHVLPYHEVESYLCHPEVVAATSERTMGEAVEFLLTLSPAWQETCIRAAIKRHHDEATIRRCVRRALEDGDWEALLAVLASKKALHSAILGWIGEKGRRWRQIDRLVATAENRRLPVFDRLRRDLFDVVHRRS